MAKIVRTKSKVTGGITDAERARMAEHVRLWTKRAFHTGPIDKRKIVAAIEGLYAAAKLKKPRVVVVPSPLVMAFSYGASAAIWHMRKKNATYAATRAATDAATDAATRAATYAATRAATDGATYAATLAATDGARVACVQLAGNFGISCAQRWSSVYQGGNMWVAYESYLTAYRDILGLDLFQHEAYRSWEEAAIHGGFRIMHDEFCMVCEFPEILLVDEQNRPHCENGPSHRWRDGWALYHWHGTRVPPHWIEYRKALDPIEVMRASNVEQRAAGAAIIGWLRMASVLKRRIIDGDPNTDVGALIELTLPGLSEPGRFLQAVCPRNGLICEGVPRVSEIDNLPINTVIAAQAWRDGLPAAEYQHPIYRT